MILRRQMRKVRFAPLGLATVLAMGGATFAFSGSSSADHLTVTEVKGSAFGYTSTVGLFGGPATVRPCANPPANNVDCRPRPAVTLPAAGSAVAITDTVATADARYGPGIIFTSGPITVSTQGTTGPTGSVTSTAGIQTINTSDQEVLTAASVSSTCTANESGVTGSTTITNGLLRISEGTDLDSDADDTVVPVPTNPAPNTTITGSIETVGDNYTYIFNEQILDVATGTLTVNAGHQVLEGPTAIGDLYFGRVVCDVTTITAPTTTTSTTQPTTSTTQATTSTTQPTTSTTQATTTTTMPTTSTTQPTTSTTTTTQPTTSTSTSTTMPTTTTTTMPTTTTTAPPPPPPPGRSQYVTVAQDGGVFAPGGEGFYGTAKVRPGDGILRDDQGRIIGASGSPLDSPVVGFSYTPTRQGYWLAQADGGVIPIGDAPDVGDLLDIDLESPIVGVAATEDGEGLYLVAADGGVFALGTAPFLGSVGGTPLEAPIVGIGLDSDGLGYYLVAADGGVFAYEADFRGSLGATPLDEPVVGIAVGGGGGYVLVASDGGAFTYDVAFAGSLSGSPLDAPIVGIAADPDGSGYWMAGADGGVFAFDAGFFGSVAPVLLNAPISGIAVVEQAVPSQD